MNVNWYLNLRLADMIDLHHAASVTILVGAKFTIFVKKGQQSWVSIGCYKLAAIWLWGNKYISSICILYSFSVCLLGTGNTEHNNTRKLFSLSTTAQCRTNIICTTKKSRNIHCLCCYKGSTLLLDNKEHCRYFCCDCTQ